jgi:hypothetical protein
MPCTDILTIIAVIVPALLQEYVAGQHGPLYTRDQHPLLKNPHTLVSRRKSGMIPAAAITIKR